MSRSTSGLFQKAKDFYNVIRCTPDFTAVAMEFPPFCSEADISSLDAIFQQSGTLKSSNIFANIKYITVFVRWIEVGIFILKSVVWDLHSALMINIVRNLFNNLYTLTVFSIPKSVGSVYLVTGFQKRKQPKFKDSIQLLLLRSSVQILSTLVTRTL